MRIGTNLHAMQAHTSLAINNKRLQLSNRRLTSGLKINSSAEDPTGLSVSHMLQIQIGGYEIARQNSSQAISLVQTADGALSALQSMVQRMRELAVQASNDTNSPEDRNKTQLEIDQLIQEIDDMTVKAEYNGIKLLNGEASPLKIQIGADKNVFLEMNIPKTTAANLGADTINVSTTSLATGSIKQLDKVLSNISDIRSSVGAYQNRLEYTLASLGSGKDTLSTALSRFLDTDMAVEMSEYTKQSVTIQAALSVIAQSNQRPAEVMSLIRKQ